MQDEYFIMAYDIRVDMPLAHPYTVDSNAWPPYEWTGYDFFSDIPGMDSCWFSRAFVLNDPECYLKEKRINVVTIIACGIDLPSLSSLAKMYSNPPGNISFEKEQDLLNRGWVVAGFDLCTLDLTSSLLYSQDYVKKLPASVINNYGLISLREDALAINSKYSPVNECEIFSPVKVLFKDVVVGNAYFREAL
ncbi:hypothetical protein ACFIQF_20665 [Comamonas sp. J-3]|uniref:hypothetical protein n=1 Tax=Comamonas trifloxystrobinivorans TaxID=3350256 RepID=UPI00372C4BFA